MSEKGTISNEVLEERLNNAIDKIDSLTEKFDKYMELREKNKATMISTIIASAAAFAASLIALFKN